MNLFKSIFSSVKTDAHLIFLVFKAVLSFHNQIPNSSCMIKANLIHPNNYFFKIPTRVLKILDFTCYHLLRIALQLSQPISMPNPN